MFQIPFESRFSNLVCRRRVGIRLGNLLAVKYDLFLDYGGHLSIKRWQACIAWSRLERGFSIDSRIVISLQIEAPDLCRSAFLTSNKQGEQGLNSQCHQRSVSKDGHTQHLKRVVASSFQPYAEDQ